MALTIAFFGSLFLLVMSIMFNLPLGIQLAVGIPILLLAMIVGLREN